MKIIIMFLAGLTMLSSLALLAQPMDFERDRNGGGMAFNEDDAVELVGVVKGVTVETPSMPNRDDSSRRGGARREQGQGLQQEEHLFIELYSGDKVDIGTKSYWKSKKVDVATGTSIRLKGIKRPDCDTYMATFIHYEDEDYDLIDNEGHPVWMKAMSGSRPGRGFGGQPPQRN